MGPVGPLPPAVYWRRRAVALAVVVVFLGLLTWGFSALVGGGDAPVAAPDPTPRPASFAAAEQAERDRQAGERAEGDDRDDPAGSAARAEAGVRAPESSAPPAASPSATPPARPDEGGTDRSVAPLPLPAPPGVSGRGVLPGAVLGPLPSTSAPSAPPAPTTAPGAGPGSPRAAPAAPAAPPSPRAAPCADGAIAVSARTDRTSYAAGEKPVLSLVVRNTGKQPCVRDLDAARQAVAVVRKPGDGVWSSDDCGGGSTDDVRVLAPGEEAVFTVNWSGRSSRPGCAGPRAPVPPGRYQLLARLDETISAPATFTLGG